MYLMIDETDLSKYVQREEYNVNAEPIYEEWQNADKLYMRKYIRSRIGGTVTLGFINGGSNTPLEDFLQLLNDNTTSDILTITVYVQNQNATREIECYYTLSGQKHFELKNGYSVDMLVMSIEEV